MIQLRPVGSFLTRFDSQPAYQPEPAPPTPCGFLDDEPAASDPDELHSISEMEDQRQALRELIERECEEKFDEERRAWEEERQAFAEVFKDERRKWAEEEAERLSAEIKAEFEAGAQALREALARLLAPFLRRQFLEISLDDFIETLRSAAADPERDKAYVELEGPPDLVDAVTEKLSRDNIACRAVTRDSFDITARIDNTIIESRMEEWVRSLKAEE